MYLDLPGVGWSSQEQRGQAGSECFSVVEESEMDSYSVEYSQTLIGFLLYIQWQSWNLSGYIPAPLMRCSILFRRPSILKITSQFPFAIAASHENDHGQEIGTRDPWLRNLYLNTVALFFFLEYEIPVSTSSGSSLEKGIVLYTVLACIGGCPPTRKHYTAMPQIPQQASASCLFLWKTFSLLKGFTSILQRFIFNFSKLPCYPPKSPKL